MNICFALDLDGTVVERGNSIDPGLIAFFEKKIDEESELFFVTGRTFFFSQPLFHGWKRSYFLAPYNGACIVKMPEKEVLHSSFLSVEDLVRIERRLLQYHIPIVAYTSIEDGERSYLKQVELSERVLSMKERRRKTLYETMHEVESFQEITRPCVAVRVLASEEEAHGILEIIRLELNLSGILMSDTVNPGSYVVQIASKNVNKAQAVRQFCTQEGKNFMVIAAGDDYNDIPLLDSADIAIAMNHAPAALKAYASIVAPSYDKGGLAKALEEALLWIE